MKLAALVLAVFVAAASYHVARALVSPILVLLTEGGLVRQNFRGRDLPVGAGLVIPLASLGPWLLLVFIYESASSQVDGGAGIALWIGLLFGMGFLGFLDDAAGSRERSGFSGHVAALLDGRPTTGSLKALFGGGLGLATGFILHGPTFSGLVAAAVISLSANAVNLLDVRPGRALKGGVVLSAWAIAGCLSAHPGAANHLAAWAAPFGASLALWRGDHEGSWMLGDVGANVLGAAAGLLAAFSPFIWQCALLLLLVALHLVSERRSLSELIEAVPLLARLDRWGR